MFAPFAANDAVENSIWSAIYKIFIQVSFMMSFVQNRDLKICCSSFLGTSTVISTEADVGGPSHVAIQAAENTTETSEQVVSVETHLKSSTNVQPENVRLQLRATNSRSSKVNGIMGFAYNAFYKYRINYAIKIACIFLILSSENALNK